MIYDLAVLVLMLVCIIFAFFESSSSSVQITWSDIHASYLLVDSHTIELESGCDLNRWRYCGREWRVWHLLMLPSDIDEIYKVAKLAHVHDDSVFFLHTYALWQGIQQMRTTTFCSGTTVVELHTTICLFLRERVKFKREK